jgi:hypothetical protein
VVPAGTTTASALAVDAGLARLQVNVTYNSTASGGQVQLLTPNGTAISPVSTTAAGSETLVLFDVAQPVAGNWRLNTTAAGAARTFRYDVTGVNSGVGYNLVAAANNGAPIAFPTPMVISAMLGKSLPIAHASGTATITDAVGRVTVLELRDDGVSPDTVANDGNYAATFYYPRTGDFNVRVDFANLGNTAVQTYNGGESSPDTTAHEPVRPADQLVNEPFIRSRTFAVTVGGAAAFSSRLVNLSILTTIVSAGDAFTLGYVVGGNGTSGAKPLVIRAAGPSLGALGVPGTLNDPKIEFFVGGTKTGENDNWGGSPAISAAMAGVGAFAYIASNSKDAAASANITTRDNSVRVSASDGGTGMVLAELYDATSAASLTSGTPRLLNVSVIKHIGTSLSAGFVIGGLAPKAVLIRAVGPTLATAPFNVGGVVADPQLALFSKSGKIGENNDWGGSAALTVAFTQVGAFALPANSKDAALLVTLAPGDYSAQVTGVGGTTGVALVEVYEVP